MFDTANWLGYEFEVHDPNSFIFWHAVPGLYIFAGLNLEGEWFPLYIGSTKSLAGRLLHHPKWLAAKLSGATHIHARMEYLKNTRESLEQKMIQIYRPCLNVQQQVHPLTFTSFQPKSELL